MIVFQKLTDPWSGVSNPEIRLSKVDFPDPEGHMIATLDPVFTDRSSLS